MILQKEFYFVRHGQTDHNISPLNLKENHREDISLNETGKKQAQSIAPIIASLPLQTVCCSPFIRAKETKEIITSQLQVDHHEIHDLGECSAEIWYGISSLGMYSSLPQEGIVRPFIERIRRGINQALSLPGPLLIVAHGGVHWALCCLMAIEKHEWFIDNCIPVHFIVGADKKWSAAKLT